jgi:hypothetical protein
MSPRPTTFFMKNVITLSPARLEVSLHRRSP